MNASYASNLKDNNVYKISPLTDFGYSNENQEIVFMCILDNKIIDYLLVMKDLVHGPTNIIAASKISRNRIIIFHKKTWSIRTSLNMEAFVSKIIASSVVN